jgi:hypothetical protein
MDISPRCATYLAHLVLLDLNVIIIIIILDKRGGMDTVPDTLLLRKSGSAENRTRTSVPVTRNPDY